MQTIQVDVWGDFACFTRPETKVERFSYPVMTPSAARGVLDAIYAKPAEFGWRISRIEVLRPIRFIALRRNEVKEKMSESAVRKAAQGGEPPVVICDATADMVGNDMQGRTQRQTIALRDVAYRISAHIHPRPGMENRQTALEEQAHRRITRGKCFYQPYLGCREFVAYFAHGASAVEPAAENAEIGIMLYDVFDLDQVVVDHATPYITAFRASLVRGRLDVPDWNSPAVLKPARGR